MANTAPELHGEDRVHPIEILETGQDLNYGRGIRLDDIKIRRDTYQDNTDFEGAAWETNST